MEDDPKVMAYPKILGWKEKKFSHMRSLSQRRKVFQKKKKSLGQKMIKKILKRKIQNADEGWSIKPWYTQIFGPIKKIQIKRAQEHEYTIDFGGSH